MSRRMINRIGEENYNKFGSKMIIAEYRKAIDIDVYFPEYDWTIVNTYYSVFKDGSIKCPYEPRVCNYGYIGEGKYKVRENGKLTKCYRVWHSMLTRCYDENYYNKYQTYTDCKVIDEWLNFQNFAKWFYENYYEIENEKMCLDKDILYKGNKIYSPDTCVFVPEKINMLFTRNNKNRGKYPIGVYNKGSEKFVAQCSVYNYKTNKKEYNFLGYYETPEQAFGAYKEFKEKNIKDVANYYKEQIPSKLYDALYNYEVEIND